MPAAPQSKSGEEEIATHTSKHFRIEGLDGLRAVAVLLVLGGNSHLFPGRLAHVGVSIFFFLSGFLITTLLMREKERHKKVSISAFYQRRALRILPPMAITLSIAAALVLLRATGPALDPPPTASGLLWQFASCTNYLFLFGGYHGGVQGMNNLWSLGVEEHFYAIYSFVFAALFVIGPQSKRLVNFLIGVCVVVLLWRCYLLYQVRGEWIHRAFDFKKWFDNDHYAFRTYFATDTRIDGIIYGCLFALVASPYSNPARAKFLAGWGPFCAGMLLLGMGLLSRPIQESVGYSLEGLGFFSIFAAIILRSEQWPFKLLETRGMIYIGRISYTFYLAHLFVLDWMVELCGGYGPKTTLITFVILMIFSSLMYFLVEKPLMSRRRKLARAG